VTPLLPLPGDEAHLWFTRVPAADDPRLREAWEPLMSPEERARYERFRVERGRWEHLTARALVRTVLSRYADVAPEAWRFRAEEHGRPRIEAPAVEPPLCFNLSHTRGLVVCLVARGREVGVDVEPLDRQVRPLAIADRFFAPEEVARLRGAAPPAAHERFLLYWTLKESYIKARGLGLRIPLRAFWFDVEREPPAIHIDPSLGDRAERWQFALLRPTAEHLVAVAIDRDADLPLRIVARETVPLHQCVGAG
jgi:4'-phosphopantetheinyl transferase